MTRPKTYIDAEVIADVRHHVTPFVVGCDRVPDSGYLSAKFAQEEIVQHSGVPFTIIRATQFFEFIPHIAESLTVKDEVRVPVAFIQPMAATDVSEAVARVALATPANGVLEIGGPETILLEGAIRRVWGARTGERPIVSDPAARYFRTALTGYELTPASGARLSQRTLDEWLSAQSG